MPRGGARAGAGRPVGATADASPKAIEQSAKAEGKTPLEYMLSVMNDPGADDVRRDRMAQAAAPYVHAKADEVTKGKKEERQEAANRAAVGKFAVPAAPSIN